MFRHFLLHPPHWIKVRFFSQSRTELGFNLFEDPWEWYNLPTWTLDFYGKLVCTYTIPMDLSYGIKTFFFGAELFSLPGKTSSSTLQNLMRICNSWFLGFKSNRMLCWNIVPFSSLFYVCELLPPPNLQIGISIRISDHRTAGCKWFNSKRVWSGFSENHAVETLPVSESPKKTFIFQPCIFRGFCC